MVVAVLGEQVGGVGDLALVELERAVAEVGEAGREGDRDQRSPRPPLARSVAGPSTHLRPFGRPYASLRGWDRGSVMHDGSVTRARPTQRRKAALHLRFRWLGWPRWSRWRSAVCWSARRARPGRAAGTTSATSGRRAERQGQRAEHRGARSAARRRRVHRRRRRRRGREHRQLERRQLEPGRFGKRSQVSGGGLRDRLCLRQQDLRRRHLPERRRRRECRQARRLGRREWKSVCAGSTRPARPPATSRRCRSSDTKLYVGGEFQDWAGIGDLDYLFACDLTSGTASSTLPAGRYFSGPVLALTADSDGVLYAGGRFQDVGGYPSVQIPGPTTSCTTPAARGTRWAPAGATAHVRSTTGCAA